ncbi:MAG: hypothetical protein WAN46_12685 [Gammaproteobacteria bacterium]|jgi:hypothetical protein
MDTLTSTPASKLAHLFLKQLLSGCLKAALEGRALLEKMVGEPLSQEHLAPFLATLSSDGQFDQFCSALLTVACVGQAVWHEASLKAMASS